MTVKKNKRTLSKEEYVVTDKVITLTEQVKPNDVVIPKGWRQLVKDPDIIAQSKSLNLDDLKQAIIDNGPPTINITDIYNFLMDIYKKHNGNGMGITYHHGFNEDGTEYEYWNINGTLTGRGGYEMFCNSMREYINDMALTNGHCKFCPHKDGLVCKSCCY